MAVRRSDVSDPPVLDELRRTFRQQVGEFSRGLDSLARLLGVQLRDDVAMDHQPLRVSGRESARHLPTQVEKFGNLQRYVVCVACPISSTASNTD
ncbi:MAG: hypothetical protein ACKV2Q_00250 [Planctomycetaceae bacterium]